VNPLLTYVIQSGIWAVCGFVIGFLAGVLVRDIRRDVHRIAEVVEGEAAVEDNLPCVPRWRRQWLRPLIGIVVITLGIFTAVQGVWQGAELRRVSGCQQAYSNGFADAIDARTQASGDAQNALDKLMSTVGAVMQSADPARRGDLQQAIRDYLDARTRAKATQQAHPYPPAPRDLCK